jgi:hypothetical protein
LAASLPEMKDLLDGEQGREPLQYTLALADCLQPARPVQANAV